MCVTGLLGDPRDAPQVLRRRLCPTGVALSIGGGPVGGQARAVGGISPQPLDLAHEFGDAVPRDLGGEGNAAG